MASPGRTRIPLDIAAAMGAALLGAFAAPRLASGSGLRLLLAGVALLVAPGYLLMQAIEPKQSQRPRHLVVALGASPPLVGLAALATALAPGGFTAQRIAWAQVLMALALGLVAFARRRAAPFSGPTPGQLLPLVPRPAEPRTFTITSRTETAENGGRRDGNQRVPLRLAFAAASEPKALPATSAAADPSGPGQSPQDGGHDKMDHT